MNILMSLIPATILAVLGFFVFTTADKAKDKVKKWGKRLAVWIFVLALLFPVGAVYRSITGQCPMMKMMSGMHGGKMEMPMQEKCSMMDMKESMK